MLALVQALCLHSASPVIFSYAIPSSARAIAVDAAGYTYVAGSTTDLDFPTTPGVYLPQSNAGQCYEGTFSGVPEYLPCPAIFVMKLDLSGSPIFSTFVGAGEARAVAVDSDGYIYIAGQTGSNFPQPAAGLSGGSAGAFVAKLDPAGKTLVYSAVLGQTAGAQAIALTPAREVVMAGYTYDPAFPVTPGAFQTAPRNNKTSAFVTKLSKDGSTLIYSTLLGGSGTQGDWALGLALDSQGAAYVTGSTSSSDFPVTGALTAASQTKNAAFVSKLSPDGSTLEYSDLLAPNAYSLGTSIALDSASDVYVGLIEITGYKDPPLAASTLSYLPYDITEGQLVNLDASGQNVLSSYVLPGAGVFSVALDRTGNAFISGYATTLNVTENALSRCSIGAFLMEISPGPPSIEFSTYLPSADVGYGVTSDSAGNVTIAANTVIYKIAPSISLLIANIPCFTGPDDYDNRTSVLAPGGIAVLRGTNLGPSDTIPATLDGSGHLASFLAGTQVMVNGIAAPLVSVQANLILFFSPFEISGLKQATVQVMRNQVASDTVTANVAEIVPALLRTNFNASGGQPILNQDYTLNTAANPAAVGSIVSIYITGGGLTTPALLDGQIAGFRLAYAVNPVQVWFGSLGNYGDVVYAGSAPGMPAGVLQINVRVPELPQGNTNPCPMIGVIVGDAQDHSLADVCITQ